MFLCLSGNEECLLSQVKFLFDDLCSLYNVQCSAEFSYEQTPAMLIFSVSY